MSLSPEPSLTIASSKTLVMEKHPLPELHLHMGVVNHLLKLCSHVESSVLDILKRHNIFRHGYQGGRLDGNNSLK